MADLPEYTAWAKVPGHLKTKTQLGKEGLRPARDQEPVAVFNSVYYGRAYPLYDRERAIPKRAMSPAQAAALAKAREASEAARACALCGSLYSPGTKLREKLCLGCFCLVADHLSAVSWAKLVLVDPEAVVLDTETTGLDCGDEIVEIAIVDVAGRVLLATLVKPQGEISEEASAVHGLTAGDLAGAPAWPEVHERVGNILRGASRIVMYNAAFDRAMLRQTRERYGLERFGVPGTRFECAMEMYAQYIGDWSDHHDNYRWVPLAGGHRARDDCLAVLSVLREMTQVREAFKEFAGVPVPSCTSCRG